MPRFELLSQPIKIGSLTLKHRMIQGPMWSRFASVSGEPTQQQIDYYSARAKGGMAMIVIESTVVDNRYRWPEPTLRLDDPIMTPSFTRLVDAIHLNGVPAIPQLINVGAFSADPISPSGVACISLAQQGVIQPRALTLEEVEEQREKYIAAAIRAKQCGCDGVLVHGATAYLLHHFISPHFNVRTDKYGGSLENRMRLPLEIVRGIRENCGPDFVIGYEFPADEFIPGGVDYETTIPFAKALEREGINYIDMMVGTYETVCVDERSPGHSKYLRFGYWEHTKVFKKEVKVPIVGRCAGDYDPHSWEKHLQAGDADIVQAAKPTLCDPEIFKKVLEDRLDDIRLCTSCFHCQNTGVVGHGQPECALNPQLGRERDYTITPALKSKKVLVVGGGPGGLEAARVAALRGHDVTLMEKGAEVGGKLKYISLCYDQELFGTFRDWEVKQCKDAGVKFELGKEATVEAIEAAKPEAVIVATGAPKHIMPDISGISKPHVVTPEGVLTGEVSVGKKVVIIGGNRIGLDLAYTIGKKKLAETITIVEPQAVVEVGYDMEIMNTVAMTTFLLPKLGVEVLTDTRVEEITDGGITVVDPEGKKHRMKADTVVISAGYEADTSLQEALQGKVKEIYAIGDCVKARNRVRDAIHEGAYRARQI